MRSAPLLLPQIPGAYVMRNPSNQQNFNNLSARFGYGGSEFTPNQRKASSSWVSPEDWPQPFPGQVRSGIGTKALVSRELAFRQEGQVAKAQFRSMSREAAQAAEALQRQKHTAWRDTILETAANTRFTRAIGSQNAFAERLVHFWSNHICIDCRFHNYWTGITLIPGQCLSVADYRPWFMFRM